MSWSYRITILYLGFVGIIITLVIISGRNKEELVSEDYYARELIYQEKIDALNNERRLPESVSHVVSKRGIELTIPASFNREMEGEIYFFCPSASVNDHKVKMNFDKDGKQFIGNNELQKGVYKMELSWTSGGKNYFKEEYVTIQ